MLCKKYENDCIRLRRRIFEIILHQFQQNDKENKYRIPCELREAGEGLAIGMWNTFWFDKCVGFEELPKNIVIIKVPYAKI